MSFLAIESAIVARLTERLPPAVRVLTAADLASVAEGSQPTPAVHVVFQRYGVTDTSPALTTVQQTWLLVVAVRNTRNARSGSGARESASEIIDAVLAAINHWRPAGAKPMTLTNAPPAQFSAGFGYFPLAFNTAINLRAESC